jgi:hypothetical protein
MFRVIMVIVLAVGLVLGLGYQNTYAVDKSLIGIWLFDEGQGNVTKDSSPNKNDGDIKDCKWVGGKFGKALEFNGTSSCIDIPHNESQSVSDDQISITAWFTQVVGGGVWCSIICKGPASGTNENYAIFANTTDKYICTVLSGAARWWTPTGNGSVPLDGKWRHYAVTFNGKEVNYYLDGESVLTQALTGNLAPNKSNLGGAVYSTRLEFSIEL